MAMSWDWVVSVIIIVGIVLTMWAKVSKQTIMELFVSMREFFQESGERGEEFIEVYD